MRKWQILKALFTNIASRGSESEEILPEGQDTGTQRADRATLDALLDQVSVMLDRHDLDSAEQMAYEALALAQHQFPDDESCLGYCYNSLGVVALQAEHYDDCERFLQQALSIQQKIFGSEHAEVAAVLQNLAVCRDLAGQLVAAESHYTDLLRLKIKLEGKHHPGLAGIYERLATLNEGFGRYSEAANYLQALLTILAEQLGPGAEELADLSIKLANLLVKGKDFYRAEGYYRYALPLCQKRYGEASTQMAQLLEQLSHVYRYLQMFDKAISCGEKLVALNLELFGEQQPQVCNALHLLANLYVSANQDQLAVDTFSRLTQALQLLSAPRYDEVAEMWLDSGDFFLRYKDVAAAEQAYQILFELAEQAPETTATRQAICLQRIAHIAFVRRNFAKAESLYFKALLGIVCIGNANRAACARIYNSLAMTALYAGKHQAAVEFARQGTDLLNGLEEQQLGLIGHNYELLSRAYAKLPDTADAEKYFYLAIAVYERIYGNGHVKCFRIKLRLAEFYRQRNQLGNSEKSYCYALDSLGKEHDFSRHEVKWAGLQLINLYRHQGKHANAKRLEEKILEQATPLLATAC